MNCSPVRDGSSGLTAPGTRAVAPAGAAPGGTGRSARAAGHRPVPGRWRRRADPPGARLLGGRAALRRPAPLPGRSRRPWGQKPPWRRGVFGPAGRGGSVVVAHRCPHDHGRNGPRAGDVDPDAGRQRRLGPRLRPAFAPCRPDRPAWPAGSASAPEVPYGGVPDGYGDRRAPGPGGRTVSFTTQSRFSRIGSAALHDWPRAARRRAPPYWGHAGHRLRDHRIAQ